MKDNNDFIAGLANAVKNSPIDAYHWDIPSGIYNLYDFTGLVDVPLKDKKMTRSEWETLIHPDDRNGVQAAFENGVSECGTVMECEYRIRVDSGSYKWLLDRWKIVKLDDCCKPQTISGILIDVSPIRENTLLADAQNSSIKEVMRQTEEEKRALLLGLHDLIHVRYIDPTMRIIWSNTHKKDGLRTRASVGGLCYQVVHRRTTPCPNCTAIKALQTGELQEEEFTLYDGRFFITRSSPVKDRNGAVAGVVQCVLNITPHKDLEKELRRINQFLQSLLDASPTPIIVSDQETKLELVNHAWEKTTGLSRRLALGQNFEKLFPKKMAIEFRKQNRKVLQSGEPIEFEEALCFRSGLNHFHTIKFPVQDGAGKTVSVGTISINVTSRKEAEKKLKKREADLRSKSRQLEEMNTALRVLLRQKEGDKKELEQRIVANVRQLVLPYVQKLRSMRLSERQMNCLDVIELHLNDIVAPFFREILSHLPNMTAKELQVATLVREGMTTKEIADLMNVSLNAVEIHRYNLRKKLGLQHKKVNLRTYLLSLS